MEEEMLLTGYCRVLDQARIVEAVWEDGRLREADCGYPGCVHAPVCPIARALEEREKQPTGLR